MLRHVVFFCAYGYRYLVRALIGGIAGVLLAAVLCAPLQAKERLLFESLSLEQGLSQSIVECIIQDRYGFLWLGTEDGLNRFDGYDFTIFKEDPADPDSLSHDNILCLLEDKDGYIWIGTYHGGLNRYDPQTGKFRRFRHDLNRPDSLSNDVVAAICQDNKGSLWVATVGGLDIWNPEKNNFLHAADQGNGWDILSGCSVTALAEDRGGRLWIGTNGSGVFRVDKSGSAPKRLDHAELAQTSVISICDDGSGRIWMGTQHLGVFRWDPKTAGMRRFEFVSGRNEGLRSPTVRSIIRDRSGEIWLGTDNGLHRFENDNQGFSVFNSTSGDPRSLGHNEVHCVFEDSSEVLWVGTYGGGVSKTVGRKNHFRHYRSNPDDFNTLSNDIVWSFWEDAEGILWIGTHGGGLDRLDRRTNRFTHYRHRPGEPSSLSDNHVRVVMQTRDGLFWLGTNNGGINRFNPRTGIFTTFRNDPDDPSSLSFDGVRCILEDSLNNLWVGTLGGGLNRMDRDSGRFTRYSVRPGDPQSISNSVVRVLYESPPGTLWIGTYGGGVDRLDIRTGRFTHLRAEPENPDALSNNYVFSIHQDPDGIFWLGTEGGLNRFDPETGKFRRFSESDGLPDNTIYGILQDNDGFLWLSTSNGLCRFDRSTGTCRNFHYVDGLQNNEFNGGSFYRNSRGELFFGGINGFNIINPARIRENHHRPPVVITDFRKFNQPVPLDAPVHTLQRVVLSHRDDMISFGFAALDFTVPGKNQYAYCMEGLSEKWIHTAANRRMATFTSLPAGRYTFRVKGSNNHGVWNQEGIAVLVRVNPPWWRTWWFQLSLLLLVLATIAISYRLRIREVKQETRLRAELSAAHNAQASIMPCRSPQIAGFDIAGASIPASEVGGDFFDYLWAGDGESGFALVVGDVSGKGMKAAMTAVMADGILCASAAQTKDIADIMNRINRSLVNKTDRSDFVAMVIASFDGMNLDFINSGLPDPVLRRGDQVLSLAPEGPRLPPGVKIGQRFRTTRRPLQPGDVLVFCSDGVTESMDRNRKLYGAQRLMRNLGEMDVSTLSAQEILDTIVADVNAFMASTEARDDITLVVVKIA